jgi:predicted small secreted protein
MMEATMKQLIIAVLALCVVALTGCNTVEGMGKDIKKAGESIEKAANK